MSIKATAGPSPARWVLLTGLIIVVFGGAYAFASARSGAGATSQSGATSQTGATGSAALSAGPGAKRSASPACACCGSSAPTKDGVTGSAAAGAAAESAGVQKISVDLSKGYYDPNVITLKAGVPAEITFGQSGGCTGQVMSQDLGFFEDLTSGPRTVELPGLDEGTYAFSCGMQMVFGKIVVE